MGDTPRAIAAVRIPKILVLTVRYLGSLRVALKPKPHRSIWRRPLLWSHSGQPMKQPAAMKQPADEAATCAQSGRARRHYSSATHLGCSRSRPGRCDSRRGWCQRCSCSPCSTACSRRAAERQRARRGGTPRGGQDRERARRCALRLQLDRPRYRYALAQSRHHSCRVRTHVLTALCKIRASVKRYPRTILSTPDTSGYRLSYKRVLRTVPHKPPRGGIF